MWSFHLWFKPTLVSAPIIIASISISASLLLTGCKTNRLAPLPTVEWQTVEDVRQILIERQDAIESVQTQLKFRITTPPPESKTHTLDAALVIRGDDHLRLRAWKLGQTIFDLTANPDGTFIVASDEMTDRAPDAEKDLARLADQLGTMLRGPDWRTADFVHTPFSEAKHYGTVVHPLTAHWPHGTAVIDEDTLALSSLAFRQTDHSGDIELTTQYTQYQGLYWYRQVSATGPFGTIKLNFYDVELNGELNPRAFKPPRRAKMIEIESEDHPMGSDPVSLDSFAGETP